jgi:hypothetical protein
MEDNNLDDGLLCFVAKGGERGGFYHSERDRERERERELVKLREQIRKTVDGEEEQYCSDDDVDTRADDAADASTLSTYLETDP